MRKRLLIAAALWPAAAGAQGVFGLGSDATVPRPGTARVTVSAGVTSFDRQFSRAGDGTLEPFLANLSADSLGVAQFRDLQATQARIRVLAADPAFTLTLGRLETSVLGRVERLPVTIEIGVVSRVSLFATVPLVRTRSAVAIQPSIGAGATAGVNPARVGGVAFRTDTALINSFSRAAAELRTRLSGCAGSSSAECAPVNSDRAAAESFAASAESFRDALRDVYLGSNAVPVATSVAHNRIAERIAAYRAQFQSYNVSSLNGAPPAPAAAAPLSLGDLNQLLADSAYGIRALPLATTERTGIGDVELGVRALLLDRLSNRRSGLRVALTGLMRLATGKSDSPRSFVDIGLGDGQQDVEAGVVADLGISSRFTATAAARRVWQLQDDERLRIPLFAGEPFPAAWQELQVTRDLGDIVELEVTPRFNLNDFFAIGTQYVIRRKDIDRYEGPLFASPDVRPLPSVGALAEGTEVTEHRVGVGVSFSNVASYRRRRARFPYELSYLHQETTRATGGAAPKARSDVVQMRIYVELFGR